VGDLGEDPRPGRGDRARQFSQAGDHRVLVDPDLGRGITAARFAEEVTGHHQADLVATEAGVEVEQLAGDPAVGVGHRLRGAGADEAVADLEIADPRGLKERRDSSCAAHS